jgi:hypothetical protein
MSFNSFLAAERISATLRLLRVLGKIGKIIIKIKKRNERNLRVEKSKWRRGAREKINSA